MDTITHAISGAVVGVATAGKDRAQIPRRALWGALFGAFPDIDFALIFFTDPLTYLNEHRGYTHSIVMLPVWASLLAFAASAFSRDRWRDMAALAAAAIALHILGDLVTSYGTKVFLPFSDAPLAWPITFIIDPLFTLILLVGLVVSLRKRQPGVATASLLMLGSYLVLQAWLQQEATTLAQRYTSSIGRPDALVVVFPQPFSPFNWKLVVVTASTYQQAYLDLLADEPRTSGEASGLFERIWTAYQPPDALQWKQYPRWPKENELREVAIAAWSQPAFAEFRQFALLPYVTSIRGDTRAVCVWFTDMRFTLRGVTPPFEYAMCRDGGGSWALELDAKK